MLRHQVNVAGHTNTSLAGQVAELNQQCRRLTQNEEILRALLRRVVEAGILDSGEVGDETEIEEAEAADDEAETETEVEEIGDDETKMEVGDEDDEMEELVRTTAELRLESSEDGR